ncbi:MAG: hypothetical protein WBH03_23605 [Cyclobacteriaceae bacterium]
MNLIIYTLNFLLFLSGFFLIAGLVKPWWVLWFLDYQNRLRVIKIYGSALVITSALRLAVSVLFPL